jgi:hypothetical protein
MDATTLPAPLLAARAALTAAEADLQLRSVARDAAQTALTAATNTAFADIDQANADVQAAVPTAQQLLNAAEQAVGDAEDAAEHATTALQMEETIWAAAQLAATGAAAAQHASADATLLAATPALATPTADATLLAATPALATPTATPTAPHGTPATPTTMIDFAALLQQSQLQNQQMMNNFQQMLQHFSPPQAPTTTTAALPTSILADPYDINKPPPNGKDPSAVRHNSSLEFKGPTTAFPVSSFLNNIKAFSKLHKTNAPALLAIGYLTGPASQWGHNYFGEQDMYKVSWNDFSNAMLKSYMVDSTADQRLLDKCKTLTQGTLSIKDYLDKSNDIYQQRKTHPFLKDYNEHFFIEMFRSGLHRDTQSRLPAITTDTTYEIYTTTALRIAAPLEALTAPTFPPVKKTWTRFNRGEKATPGVKITPFGAVTPMPPAGQDELSRAAWELANLTPEQRRQARMLRGACTYCGISTHLRDSCPELAKKTGGVNGVAAASQGILPNPASTELAAVNFTIDSGNGNGATQY